MLSQLYELYGLLPHYISLCDRLLLTGYINEQWKINKDMVNEAACELRLSQSSAPHPTGIVSAAAESALPEAKETVPVGVNDIVPIMESGRN